MTVRARVCADQLLLLRSFTPCPPHSLPLAALHRRGGAPAARVRLRRRLRTRAGAARVETRQRTAFTQRKTGAGGVFTQLSAPSPPGCCRRDCNPPPPPPPPLSPPTQYVARPPVASNVNPARVVAVQVGHAGTVHLSPMPPIAPVVKLQSRDAMKATRALISAMLPQRFMGILSAGGMCVGYVAHTHV